MITIDITMIIHLINMLVLIVIMNAVLYKPIRNILEERQQKIGDMETEVENFRRNVKLRIEELDRKLNNARIQAKDALEKVRAEAAAAGNTTLSAVREEMTGFKSEKILQIRTEFDAARRELKGQIGSFASEMVGKILGRSI